MHDRTTCSAQRSDPTRAPAHAALTGVRIGADVPIVACCPIWQQGPVTHSTPARVGVGADVAVVANRPVGPDSVLAHPAVSTRRTCRPLWSRLASMALVAPGSLLAQRSERTRGTRCPLRSWYSLGTRPHLRWGSAPQIRFPLTAGRSTRYSSHISPATRPPIGNPSRGGEDGACDDI